MTLTYTPLWMLERLYQMDRPKAEQLLELLRPSERLVLCDIEGINPKRRMYRVKTVAMRMRLPESQVRALSRSARRKIRSEMFIRRLNEADGLVDGFLKCPNCEFEGSLSWDFDIGGLPDGIVICNRCFCTIEVETGARYDGPLDEEI